MQEKAVQLIKLTWIPKKKIIKVSQQGNDVAVGNSENSCLKSRKLVFYLFCLLVGKGLITDNHETSILICVFQYLHKQYGNQEK